MILPDNRIVKASFRDCPISDRNQFKHSHCLLTISVGQPAHEGKKLEAALSLVSKSFRMCTILVGDVLQRHNLMQIYQLNESQALQMSLSNGDQWIKRNQSIITQHLRIPRLITRWNDWLNHPSFSEKLAIIRHESLSNQNFQSAFDHTAEEFLIRQNQEDSNNLKIACFNYLEEECAAMLLWIENQYNFEVYPSGRNIAMAITYESLIKPHHPSLLKPVALRFKKYSSHSTFSLDPLKNHQDLSIIATNHA